jgi:hypothetical protein
MAESEARLVIKFQLSSGKTVEANVPGPSPSWRSELAAAIVVEAFQADFQQASLASAAGQLVVGDPLKAANDEVGAVVGRLQDHEIRSILCQILFEDAEQTWQANYEGLIKEGLEST